MSQEKNDKNVMEPSFRNGMYAGRRLLLCCNLFSSNIQIFIFSSTVLGLKDFTQSVHQGKHYKYTAALAHSFPAPYFSNWNDGNLDWCIFYEVDERIWRGITV